MSLEKGHLAPHFELPQENGDIFKLSQARGHFVVLYFYPKDDTPGCTKESCAFRDLHGVFQQKNALIFGISKDSLQSHQKFKNKYSLPFPLLADEEKSVIEAYGVWKEKKNYGKTYMGIERTTFLIDPQGKIKHIWRNVKVDGHVEAVLNLIDA